MVEPAQPELPLPAPPLPADMPPLPARMVNEYQYCPRLAYLMWVQGEWSDSADTVEGGLAAFIDATQPDELMITAHIYDQATRLRSIEILAQVRDRLASPGRAGKASKAVTDSRGPQTA